MKCHPFLLYFALIYSVSSISIQNEQKDELMYILIDKEMFPIKLIDNPVSEELITILPLRSQLINKDISKIELSLNARIKTVTLFQTINSPIEVQKGDLLLYQGKKLILYNESTILNNNEGDFLKIGNCNSIDELSNKIGNNKSIFLYSTLDSENYEGKINPYDKYNSIMNYFTWKIFTFFCFVLL